MQKTVQIIQTIDQRGYHPVLELHGEQPVARDPEFRDTVLLEEHLWSGYASELFSCACVDDGDEGLILRF